MTFEYILSQIFTTISYILLGLTYFAKSKHKIVIYSCISILANTVAFTFLGAWSGLAMCFVTLFRNFYLLWEEKKYGKKPRSTARKILFPTILYAVIIALAILTYQGPLSLLSIFATSLYTLSILQKNTKVYKFLGIPTCILWVLYNIYIGSIFGIILESTLLVVSAIGFVQELVAKPKTQNSR
ncbi:YgjV family protein [Candidatus Saccharibacteria bacterium]|nr:YgjV family protein [Candidatus Saccharibacteria bacterium]